MRGYDSDGDGDPTNDDYDNDGIPNYLDTDSSKMGAITEYFRTQVATERSAHPLEPVAVDGPDAFMYVKGHHTDGTPYGLQSPWMKHLDSGGQLLYIGTTLINSGTSLHAVEDAIGWKSLSFPIYLKESKPFPSSKAR